MTYPKPEWGYRSPGIREVLREQLERRESEKRREAESDGGQGKSLDRELGEVGDS